MMRPGQRRPASYEEPYLWWGPVWEPQAERSIVDLIRDGVIEWRVAALLWGMIQQRASVVVAAAPRGAGKTTVLTALLDFLPEGTRRVYLRGSYEPFAFAEDPALDPRRSALLINEISAHLPGYLWGPGVRRAFALTRRGFGLAATAHATSIEDLIGQLASYPLMVPVADLAAINVVVLLAAERQGGAVRRWVDEVWLVGAGRDRGLTVDLAAGQHDISQDLMSRLAATSPAAPSALVPGIGELNARAEYLHALAASPLGDDPAAVRRLLQHGPGLEPPFTIEAPEG